MFRNLYNKFYEWFMDMLSYIQWKPLRKRWSGVSNTLTEKDFEEIKKVLKKHNRIILTEDRAHLSSWAVKLGHKLLGVKILKPSTWKLIFKPCKYTHAFTNVEKLRDKEFKFIESINSGVTDKSSFEDVFAADSVCILRAKNYTDEEFDNTVDSIVDDIGKKYDKRFKWDDNTDMSCIEVILERLKGHDQFEFRMSEFIESIKKYGNVTPQMIADCSEDFEIVLEIKR